MQAPREGKMAVVRNRRAMITAVAPIDADEQGRFRLVDVEYTHGFGVEADEVLWGLEPGAELLEPAALPKVGQTPPKDPRELNAIVRAARWSALTSSLPFSALFEERPPLSPPLQKSRHARAPRLSAAPRAAQVAGDRLLTSFKKRLLSARQPGVNS